MVARSLVWPSRSLRSKSGSYAGAPVSPRNAAPNRLSAMLLPRAARLRLILESSSTTVTWKLAPSGPPRFFAPLMSNPVSLAKPSWPLLSLNAPRIWSENSHTGSCGTALPPNRKRRIPRLWRMTGSAATNRRERLVALRAMYSACSASRSA